MRSFTYTLNHDRAMPLVSIGRLVSIADCYPDTVGKLEKGSRWADLAHPLRMAALGLRKGDAITVSVEGPSEVEMFDVLCSNFDSAM